MDNTEYRVRVDSLAQQIEGDEITEGEALQELEEEILAGASNEYQKSGYICRG